MATAGYLQWGIFKFTRHRDHIKNCASCKKPFVRMKLKILTSIEPWALSLTPVQCIAATPTTRFATSDLNFCCIYVPVPFLKKKLTKEGNPDPSPERLELSLCQAS